MSTSDPIRPGEVVRLSILARGAKLAGYQGKKGLVISIAGSVVTVRFGESDEAQLPDCLLVREETSRFRLDALTERMVNSKPLSIALPAGCNIAPERFEHALAASISLGPDDKRRILDAIPRCTPAQIEMLVSIFDEEARKFADLLENAPRHREEVVRLMRKHAIEWAEISDAYRRNNGELGSRPGDEADLAADEDSAGEDSA